MCLSSYRQLKFGHWFKIDYWRLCWTIVKVSITTPSHVHHAKDTAQWSGWTRWLDNAKRR